MPAENLSRQDWIDEALGAISDDGHQSLTINDLAARLGATKGSFYHHFKDRTALIVELSNLRAQVVEDFATRADTIEDRVDRFRSYCIDAFSSSSYLNIDVFFERERVSNLEIDKALKAADDRAYAWQLQAVKDLGFNPPDAQRHLRVMLAASIGLILLMMHEDIALPLEERIEFANTMVDMAIASAQSGSA